MTLEPPLNQSLTCDVCALTSKLRSETITCANSCNYSFEACVERHRICYYRLGSRCMRTRQCVNKTFTKTFLNDTTWTLWQFTKINQQHPKKSIQGTFQTYGQNNFCFGQNINKFCSWTFIKLHMDAVHHIQVGSLTLFNLTFPFIN